MILADDLVDVMADNTSGAFSAISSSSENPFHESIQINIESPVTSDDGLIFDSPSRPRAFMGKTLQRNRVAPMLEGGGMLKTESIRGSPFLPKSTNILAVVPENRKLPLSKKEQSTVSFPRPTSSPVSVAISVPAKLTAHHHVNTHLEGNFRALPFWITRYVKPLYVAIIALVIMVAAIGATIAYDIIQIVNP